MNVYLHPSGVKKELKNAYIGEYKGYEYSYDFIGKTTTQLTNDGWINVSGLTTGSNGITASSWTAVQSNLNGLVSAMNNARKLTLEMKTYISNTRPCTSGLALVNDLNNTNQNGFYYDHINFCIIINSNDAYKPSHTKSTGLKTITCVFDFVNKTYSGNYIGGNGTFSGTLTDAQILGMRGLGYIYIPLEEYSYVQKISILVE